VEYAWSGTIAGTPDFLPRMIKLAPNLYGAIGCNGRGVALTTALGREIAELCAGIQNEADFVLPITPPRTIPFSRLAGAAPHLWLPWSNLADAYETHRPPT
jgi:glycine/D-amino acid oxidase-like deaminating enzyme